MMDKLKHKVFSFNTILYWLCYVGYLYIILPASFNKVVQQPLMLENMRLLGFEKNWTIAIGIVETIGVLIVLTGLFKPHFRTLGILFLFPFAIGAFTAHMAHQEYYHFYKSLIMCVLSFVLLCLDKGVSVNLKTIKV